MLVNLGAADLFSLKGKTVLLTGSSGYLGRTFGRADCSGCPIALGLRLLGSGLSSAPRAVEREEIFGVWL